MKHNFYAGPAILPKEVLAQASQAAKELPSEGLSLLEISHRGKFIVGVMDKAVSLCKELLGLSDDYSVLFLTGGASSQFYMAPMNFLNEDQTAAYVDTGTWSTKAIKEAKLYGNVEVVASSKEQNFDHIPQLPDLSAGDYRYLHITSNNTITGTQYDTFPDTPVRMICDMSSDIFSRRFDANKFDLIYAGAQKNMGPAGTTLAIVKNSAVGHAQRQIPTMLNYQTHINKKSSFNTPPVFPIYVSMLTMQWVKDQGGVQAMEARNQAKADLLYGEIDRNACFSPNIQDAKSRSKMNVCFQPTDESLKDRFLDYCAEQNLVGLDGHRSVGGFRASIYNALSLESVQVLVETMQEFERSHA